MTNLPVTANLGLHSLSSLGFVLAAVACSSSGPNAPAGASGAGSVAGAANAGSAGTPAGVNATAGNSSSAGSGAASAGANNGIGGAAGASGANAAGRAGGASSAGSAGSAGSTGGVGGAGGTSGVSGAGPTVALPPLVTSAPGAYWKTDGVLTPSNASSADVTVDDSATAQQWDGFGAAFNEQGWAFLSSSAMQRQAMTLLFSGSDGAAFAWGRIPIGANDYAVSRYTLDDTGSDVVPNDDESNRPAADTALSMFSLARDNEKLIPYVKAAQAVKPNLRFWASPWSPPVWMKTGFRKTDGWDPVKRASYYDGGSMKSDATTLSAYAQYFARFVQGYQAQGIDIELVAPQEEPNYEQSYPSCLWDKATYAAFIGSYLGPAMTSLGVKIMLGTLADQKDFDQAGAALADTSAKAFSTVIGLQWGALWYQTQQAALGTSLPFWATEHKGGNYPWNPSGFPPYVSYAPNDQAYGVESWSNIRDAITKTKVSSYNAWNTVLDGAGWSIDTTRQWAQNALLVADSGTLTATPAYYVFRHLSQYVAPGATVVGTTGGDALAFKNPDGSLVAVLFNSGAANSSYVIAIGGKRLAFAMPSNGWATVQYKP